MDTPQNINIQISSGTILKTLCFVVFLWLLFFLKDIVLVILTAVVIASSVEPPTLWFMKKGISRVFSVFIVYILLGLLLAGFIYTFIPLLLQDTSQFLGSVPQYIDSLSLWSPFGAEETEQSKEVAVMLASDIETSRAAVVAPDGRLSLQAAINNINSAITSISEGFVHTASSIFGGALGFILIVVISFYLSVQDDGVEKFLRIITPIKSEAYVINLWKRTQKKIGLWMQGQLVLAVLVGVLVYLGLTVLGVRNALLFAVLAGFMEIIPLFGPIIAAVPAVATAYTDGGASFGLLVVGLYVIIQQFENHLIYPLVVTKIVGVPPILVIISLIVGYKLAGFLGILLSVPMSSMLVEFLDDVQRKKHPAATAQQ